MEETALAFTDCASYCLTNILEQNSLTSLFPWPIPKFPAFVYSWLRTLAMFDVIYFPLFVKASDVNSSIVPLHCLSYVV